MPTISREPTAPSKLKAVISCRCNAEGKAWSGRCSYGSNGMSCTSYCVRIRIRIILFCQYSTYSYNSIYKKNEIIKYAMSVKEA